ncbi:helix-turn-helix transcriptional regulator [uncultured Clostridium sp.]|uniref:helix-turn-helix transcriptional regulator n=1 Tax=uncultured Clostridium sp. TaxID=59620 RepID=UPI0035227C63
MILYRCNRKSSNNLNTCNIDLISIGETLGDKLKYYRLKNNLTQDKLAQLVGFKNSSCIKDIETNRRIPGRKASKKLASIFKLNTIYFFDEYLECTHDLAKKLKEFRQKNNLTIKSACLKYELTPSSWSSWENKKSYIKRNKLYILRDNNII